MHSSSLHASLKTARRPQTAARVTLVQSSRLPTNLMGAHHSNRFHASRYIPRCIYRTTIAVPVPKARCCPKFRSDRWQGPVAYAMDGSMAKLARHGILRKEKVRFASATSESHKSTICSFLCEAFGHTTVPSTAKLAGNDGTRRYNRRTKTASHSREPSAHLVHSHPNVLLKTGRNQPKFGRHQATNCLFQIRWVHEGPNSTEFGPLLVDLASTHSGTARGLRTARAFSGDEPPHQG